MTPQEANEAVIEATDALMTTIRTEEAAILARDAAHARLEIAREDLYDALLINAGLPARYAPERTT